MPYFPYKFTGVNSSSYEAKNWHRGSPIKSLCKRAKLTLYICQVTRTRNMCIQLSDRVYTRIWHDETLQVISIVFGPAVCGLNCGTMFKPGFFWYLTEYGASIKKYTNHNCWFILITPIGEARSAVCRRVPRTSPTDSHSWSKIYVYLLRLTSFSSFGFPGSRVFVIFFFLIVNKCLRWQSWKSVFKTRYLHNSLKFEGKVSKTSL